MFRRIRLTLGALTASPKDSGSFAFFLYQDKSDKCIVIPLNPPQMHTMFSIFKEDANSDFCIHSVFENVLREFKVELLEVEIIASGDSSEYLAELLLFDGERETKKLVAIVDGIILAKKFGAPLYISSKLMSERSVVVDDISNLSLRAQGNKDEMDRLMELFNEAIESENYERAALINSEIEKLKKELNKKS